MSVITLQEAFPKDYGPAWVDGLEREFRRGVELEKVQYMARQLQARQEAGEVHKMVDGLGQCTHVWDARTYFRWLKEDPHFWEDQSNVRKFEQDNPECKVKTEKPIRIMT